MTKTFVMALFLCTSVPELFAGDPPSPWIVGSFEQASREFLPSGSLPVPEPVTQIADPHGHLYVATPEGLDIQQDGQPVYTLDGEGGLPVQDIRCLAMAPDGDVWMGTPQGVVRLTQGRIEYYAGQRWLPEDEVQSIECLEDHSVRAYTPSGISHIHLTQMTLEQKSDHYERLTDARHKRWDLVTGCGLPKKGDLSEWKNGSDDNDGLWTAMYIAAESFRYAATRSDAAENNARSSMRALLKLESITGIPGFPARSMVHRSEDEFGKERGGEWHKTPDQEWEWKGDTSSDEMDGHYFAWSIYYDLVALDEEKAAIQATCRRVTDHILDNNFYLVDADGKPTRWGVWAPEQLNKDFRWMGERGLNSLEILSYLKVAHHITGEERYAQAYRDLIDKHHYALNTLFQKISHKTSGGALDNHSDDELAFLSYYSLLRHEEDPALRALYLLSLDRAWQIERPEACPLWNFIYGALSGESCDAEASVASLQGIPLDLIDWKMINSHRLDIDKSTFGSRHGRKLAQRVLPWPERPLHKWNGDPYILDGGDAHGEECGTFWLLPYWMGRYHGIIQEG